MRTIKLIRELPAPGDRGPSRGMHALQSLIRAANIPWLKVGDHLNCGDIPWVWNYRDAGLAMQFEEFGWPWIVGPNVLFGQSWQPGAGRHESAILDAENCIMQFTESEWYAALIQRHCNHNEAPIVIWSYPISPLPEGPLPVEYDVLIYLKDRTLGREEIRTRLRWPRSRTFVYGYYDRDDLIETARRSRCVLYLSSDDRGPLAAAECAIAGAPLIGIERGCPWVLAPGISVEVQHFGVPNCCDAIEKAAAMDRDAVRSAAVAMFSGERTMEIIRKALEPIATGQ